MSTLKNQKASLKPKFDQTNQKKKVGHYYGEWELKNVKKNTYLI